MEGDKGVGEMVMLGKHAGGTPMIMSIFTFSGTLYSSSVAGSGMPGQNSISEWVKSVWGSFFVVMKSVSVYTSDRHQRIVRWII